MAADAFDSTYTQLECIGLLPFIAAVQVAAKVLCPNLVAIESDT